MAFDFARAVYTFQEYAKELHVKVVGGDYTDASGNVYVFHGVDYTEIVKKLLGESTNVKTSYVALRDAETVLANIQEVRLSVMIVKAEMKSVINNGDLSKNPQVSSYYRAMKEAYDKVCSYLEICDKQYDFLTEILWSTNQVNTAINRRFFNGDDVGYHYKNEEV